MNDLHVHLMNLEEIAAMHRCTLKHARDILVKLPGFPEPAPTSTPRKRLWVAREVVAYVNRGKKVG